MIEEVAALRQILPSFVEKDWYVTQAIESISRVNAPGFRVVFTGGTALSIAHGLLERFSEDVDFRIMADGAPNRGALSNFKQTIVQALRDGGFAFDDDKIRARDGNRYFSIDLEYQTDFPQADALRPHIQ
ncbi:MAG: nucleotidyl transferase AbiEii/AbiGii toxin family protein, partial [Burkholderiales bacterium]